MRVALILVLVPLVLGAADSAACAVVAGPWTAGVVTDASCGSPIAWCLRGAFGGLLPAYYELALLTRDGAGFTGETTLLLRDGAMHGRDTGWIAAPGPAGTVASLVDVHGGTGRFAETFGKLFVDGALHESRVTGTYAGEVCVS